MQPNKNLTNLFLIAVFRESKKLIERKKKLVCERPQIGQ